MTEDDIGYAKKDGSEKEKPHARQNVILEFGMLMGTLGRENIIILRQEGDLEEPSDIKGILTRRFKDHIQETCFDLAASLKKAGFDIDNESISRAAK